MPTWSKVFKKAGASVPPTSASAVSSCATAGPHASASAALAHIAATPATASTAKASPRSSSSRSHGRDFADLCLYRSYWLQSSCGVIDDAVLDSDEDIAASPGCGVGALHASIYTPRPTELPEEKTRASPICDTGAYGMAKVEEALCIVPQMKCRPTRQPRGQRSCSPCIRRSCSPVKQESSVPQDSPHWEFSQGGLFARRALSYPQEVDAETCKRARPMMHGTRGTTLQNPLGVRRMQRGTWKSISRQGQGSAKAYEVSLLVVIRHWRQVAAKQDPSDSRLSSESRCEPTHRFAGKDGSYKECSEASDACGHVSPVHGHKSVRRACPRRLLPASPKVDSVPALQQVACGEETEEAMVKDEEDEDTIEIRELRMRLKSCRAAQAPLRARSDQLLAELHACRIQFVAAQLEVSSAPALLEELTREGVAQAQCVAELRACLSHTRSELELARAHGHRLQEQLHSPQAYLWQDVNESSCPESISQSKCSSAWIPDTCNASCSSMTEPLACIGESSNFSQRVGRGQSEGVSHNLRSPAPAQTMSLAEAVVAYQAPHGSSEALPSQNGHDSRVQEASNAHTLSSRTAVKWRSSAFVQGGQPKQVRQSRHRSRRRKSRLRAMSEGGQPKQVGQGQRTRSCEPETEPKASASMDPEFHSLEIKVPVSTGLVARSKATCNTSSEATAVGANSAEEAMYEFEELLRIGPPPGFENFEFGTVFFPARTTKQKVAKHTGSPHMPYKPDSRRSSQRGRYQ